MSLPKDPAALAEDQAHEASDTLSWQLASARAAVVKHHARLVDQLDAQGPHRPPFEDGNASD